MSINNNDRNKESKESDYSEDRNQLEENQEEETGELDEQRKTTNKVFDHLIMISYGVSIL